MFSKFVTLLSRMARIFDFRQLKVNPLILSKNVVNLMKCMQGKLHSCFPQNKVYSIHRICGIFFSKMLFFFQATTFTLTNTSMELSLCVNARASVVGECTIR